MVSKQGNYEIIDEEDFYAIYPKETAEYAAYLTIYPNPIKYPLGIIRNETQPGELVFWVKIGDTGNLSQRASEYGKANPCMVYLGFNLNSKPVLEDKSHQTEKEGKIMEYNTGLQSLEFAGNGQSVKSKEWHALYFKKDSSEIVKKSAEDLSTKIKNHNALNYKAAEEIVKDMMNKTSGRPGRDKGKLPKSPPLQQKEVYQGISITPSIHAYAHSLGLKADNSDKYRIYVKSEQITNTGATVFEELAKNRRTELPTFAYNLGKDLKSITDIIGEPGDAWKSYDLDKTHIGKLATAVEELWEETVEA